MGWSEWCDGVKGLKAVQCLGEARAKQLARQKEYETLELAREKKILDRTRKRVMSAAPRAAAAEVEKLVASGEDDGYAAERAARNTQPALQIDDVSYQRELKREEAIARFTTDFVTVIRDYIGGLLVILRGSLPLGFNRKEAA